MAQNSPSHRSQTGPAGWPDGLLEVFERSLVAETVTVSRGGHPITVPLTPYLGADRRTIDVNTVATFPAKVERARRNPRVALLFTDFEGTGLASPPAVLVQGLATVRDGDLQGNVDRFLPLAMAKFPGVFSSMPRFVFSRQVWYLARIWMLVTPVRMWWWPSGDWSRPPQRWEAPAATTAPPSDPAPPGRAPIQAPPARSIDWRAAAERAIGLGRPVVAAIDEDGFPVLCPAVQAELDADGFRLTMPAGRPPMRAGPASISFHLHNDDVSVWTHTSFLGALAARDGDAGLRFRVDRALGTMAISGGRLKGALQFFRMGRALGPKLARECQRRGQPVPTIRWPA